MSHSTGACPELVRTRSASMGLDLMAAEQQRKSNSGVSLQGLEDDALPPGDRAVVASPLSPLSPLSGAAAPRPPEHGSAATHSMQRRASYCPPVSTGHEQHKLQRLQKKHKSKSGSDTPSTPVSSHAAPFQAPEATSPRRRSRHKPRAPLRIGVPDSTGQGAAAPAMASSARGRACVSATGAPCSGSETPSDCALSADSPASEEATKLVSVASLAGGQ